VGSFPLHVWDISHKIASMDTQTELIAEIEAFVSRTGLAETTLGGRAVKDSRFVSRLREGRNVGIKSVESLRAFMREYRAAHRGEAA
jgi:hypothetical protein